MPDTNYGKRQKAARQSLYYDFSYKVPPGPLVHVTEDGAWLPIHSLHMMEAFAHGYQLLRVNEGSTSMELIDEPLSSGCVASLISPRSSIRLAVIAKSSIANTFAMARPDVGAGPHWGYDNYDRFNRR